MLIPGQASLESRTLILLSGMAAYTALMSLTAVCVIRYGKVWDDARSILMIVAGMNAACLVAAGCILSQQDWQPMLHDHTWLPVPLRVACFLIAVGISFVKTGSHRPLLAYLCSRLLMREYQLGL